MSPPPGSGPRRPVVSYRLQLRNGIGFGEARGLLPYLDRLGVSDLYLSPVLSAEPGSAHGYDVIDPTRLDPALGGRRAFEALAHEARRRRMGVVVDIVPNHMAASPADPWWFDLLRRGRRSPSARVFDIDWSAPGADGKVLLPILDRPLGDALAQGAIVLEREGGALRLACGDLRLPLSAPSERWVRVRGPDAGAPATADLLAAQVYRPVWWRRGPNYRRFFDIGGLVGVRQEDPRVFDRTHSEVIRLVRSGAITGLRVDHVDGLLDPRRYLERLRRRSAVPSLWVEKIFQRDESLPAGWPVDGSTGYGMLNDLGDLFVDAAGWRELGEVTGRLRGAPLPPFEGTRLSARRDVLEERFGAELDALVRDLRPLARAAGAGLDTETLRSALVEVTAALEVYRTYADRHGIGPEDRRRIERVIRRARSQLPPEGYPALCFLRRVLLLDLPASAPVRTRSAWLGFVRRWQQLTGPVAAKGVEDTALYRDIRLLSRNEVGADPGAEPLDPRAFHRRIGEHREGPRPLLPLSTHDTKRSEDVRARIAVLSELPERWEAGARRWMRINRPLRSRVQGGFVPSPDEELFLYQTLLGVWPDGDQPQDLVERIRAYVVKAAREAKTHTDWLRPDEAHESALQRFAGELLEHAPFLRSFARLQRTVAFHGALNSLSQVVLRTALPGVVDVYNGTETWDLSLVDPDNRRPVDFQGLRGRLEDLDRRAERDLPALAVELLGSWADGRIKLHVVARCLRLRRRLPAVFLEGDYLPASVHGPRAAHAVAVVRRSGDRWALAVVPRLTVRLAGAGRPPVGARVWSETAVSLPRGAPRRWTDELTGTSVRAGVRGGLALAEVLSSFPVSLLVPER